MNFADAMAVLGIACGICIGSWAAVFVYLVFGCGKSWTEQD